MFSDSQFKKRKVGKALVVSFTGDVEKDVQHMSPEFIGGLLGGNIKVIALDMKKVKKFLSVSITHLIKILRMLEKEESKLFLLHVPDRVMKILSMVNIIAKFNIVSSDAELLRVQDQKPAPKDAEEKKPRFKIAKEIEGDNHIIGIVGSFVEGQNSEMLIEEIKCSISQGAVRITLDFAKTEVIDTVSVGTLLTLHEICNNENVKIRASNANNLVHHVLNTNEVGKLFGI
jgi:anti-anti-sigma factor